MALIEIWTKVISQVGILLKSEKSDQYVCLNYFGIFMKNIFGVKTKDLLANWMAL